MTRRPLFTEDLGEITGFRDRGFFFDTNVWYYIYGPSNFRSYAAEQFSNFYGKLVKSRRKIFAEPCIFTEFVNLYLRNAYQVYCTERGLTNSFKYKEFRATQAASDCIDEIADVVSHIQKDCELIDSTFTGLDLDRLFALMRDKKVDFNDALYGATCQRHNFILVTNDRDCSALDIDIVTVRGPRR